MKIMDITDMSLDEVEVSWAALAVLDQLLDSLHDSLLEFLWGFLALVVVADTMIIITKNSRSSGIFYNYDSQ